MKEEVPVMTKADMITVSLNTFRLSVRTVGFKDRRDQYILHINCSCNLKKSLVGEYHSIEEAQSALPAWCRKDHSLQHCLKNQPIVKAAPETAKKTRKPQRRTLFTNSVVSTIERAPDNGVCQTVAAGYTIRVTRANSLYQELAVMDDRGNFFEFRCPFTAKNSKQIAKQVWDLMQTMGL